MAKLYECISASTAEKCGKAEHPVLSITMKDGIVLQSDKFKKRIASADTSDYICVPYGKLVQGIHIDEGNFGVQDIVPIGIVSPAYKLWNINDAIVLPKYIELVLRSPKCIDYYRSKLTGTVNRRGRMSVKDFLDMDIPLPDKQTQAAVIKNISKVNELINLRKKQLAKLDQLVKSRFVEMFGDPIANEKGWPMVTIDDVAEIRIGPFGTLLHKEDYISDGHALVNPSHIVDGKIAIDNGLTISDTKYEELSAYHLQLGDVVLGRRGEMGRCAVVYENGLLCGTGSMIIRPNERMRPYFLQSIISNPAYKKIIEDKAVGVTMLNLNVPIVSALTIPQLPVELQDQFIALMEEVDKSKLTIQASLDKLELLKKSLMQQYFG